MIYIFEIKLTFIDTEKEVFDEKEEKIKERLQRMEKLKVLTTLLKNKFKFQEARFSTRESKIPLNSLSNSNFQALKKN